MTETWRVILDDGNEREVRVNDHPIGGFEAQHGTARADGVTARLAVMRLALAREWPVWEILAPGYPSCAESLVVRT